MCDNLAERAFRLGRSHDIAPGTACYRHTTAQPIWPVPRRAALLTDASTPHADPTRLFIALEAFRRNQDQKAAELRAEIPVLLGRLAAEAPGSMLELVVQTGADGIVRGAMAVQGGQLTAELADDVAAILHPVAELEIRAEEPGDPDVAVWPLVASARIPLGFSADTVATNITQWSATGARGIPELVELVSPYAGVGLRIRLRPSVEAGPGYPLWDLEYALLCQGTVPSLRLRAAVRARYPGLEVAGQPGGEPAVLRVGADDLPSAFVVPIADEDPIPGTFVGSAAPLPMHPSRQVPSPERAIRVGSSVTMSGKEAQVALSLQERLRHVHVLGRTGTGKSTLLAGIANAVAGTGDGMLVLDPHGPLIDRIVSELPESAAERTWIIRCGDVENPVPVNPMAVSDPVRREIAIDDICSAFQYLFDKKNTGIVGPRFRERVSMGLRALAAMFGPRASLLDVPVALADDSFMTRAFEAAKDDRLKAWVRNDMNSRRSTDYGEVVSWVNSKFEAFTSTAAMRAILGSGEDALDMSEVMDSGQIMLVDLSKGDLGESATALLGYLYLNEAWIGALQRKDPARPFTVIADEAQALVSGSLSAMLSEGRKFGLSVVLAHQYLQQLDEDLQPAVDGNVATTVAFRAAGADVPALRQRFGNEVDGPTLMTLPDLSAITLRTAADVTGEPYTLVVDYNERACPRTGAELRRFSDALLDRTVTALVDPYRERAAAAAAGKSNLSDLGPARRSAPPEKPAGGPKSTSFLDEWMAKRQKAAADPGAAAPDVAEPDHTCT